MTRPGRSGAYATRLAVAGLVLTTLACGSSRASDTATQPGAAAATSTAKPVHPAARVPAKPAAAACTPASLERQAAATLIVGLPDTRSGDDPLATSIPALGVGGILLTSANVQDAYQVRALVASLRARRGAPLLIATDEEGGRVSTFSGVLGYQPSARSSGALTPAALRQRAAVLGRQLRSLGVTVDFAPVLDVTGGPDDAPIGDRSYSSDPATASADGLAVARGLADGEVTPVLKHFPGLGEADADTHVSAPIVDVPELGLRYRDMRPFIDAIGAGAPVVMVGHARYPALGDVNLPASLSPAVYRHLRALKFRGVTITDSLGMGAVNLRYDFPVAAVMALAAGSDGLLSTDGNQALRMRDAIVAAVRAHLLPAARLADAAARVTALAGGDPYRLTCRHVSLPALR